jgi:Uncharacterized conserved protein (DUF2190)
VSEFGPGIDVGLVAGEDLTTFRFVALGDDGLLYQATGASDELVVGVTGMGVSAGDAVPATFTGVAKIEAAEQLYAGAPIVSDGYGRAANWIDALSPTLGVCLRAAAGASEITLLLFTPRTWPVVDGEVIPIFGGRYS